MVLLRILYLRFRSVFYSRLLVPPLRADERDLCELQDGEHGNQIMSDDAKIRHVIMVGFPRDSPPEEEENRRGRSHQSCHREIQITFRVRLRTGAGEQRVAL